VCLAACFSLATLAWRARNSLSGVESFGVLLLDMFVLRGEEGRLPSPTVLPFLFSCRGDQ